MYLKVRCTLPGLLDKANLTPIQLAELTGIPKSSISNYMNDKHVMSLLNAYRISRVLECTIEDLYQWEWVRDAKGR